MKNLLCRSFDNPNDFLSAATKRRIVSPMNDAIIQQLSYFHQVSCVLLKENVCFLLPFFEATDAFVCLCSTSISPINSYNRLSSAIAILLQRFYARKFNSQSPI